MKRPGIIHKRILNYLLLNTEDTTICVVLNKKDGVVDSFD
jgi:hypothetical protein